jgi:AcrR family transcriptional regulator
MGTKMPDDGRSTIATAASSLGQRARRRNIDRSATTRRQILEATVTLLESDGYGAVTNIRVAEAAGVSRGAMMHHFPTRQDLLVATVEHAYAKLSDYRQQEFDRLEPGLPRYRSLIDLAWATARMPEGVACNEIRAGSRSDPEIRKAVTPMMSRIADDYARLVGRLAREAGLVPDPELQGLTATTVMATRSMAINGFTYPRERLIENVLTTLKTMREDIIARQLGEHLAQRPAINRTGPQRRPDRRSA